MKFQSAGNARSLLNIATVHERTAQMMAEVVHEAERAGRTDSARSLWLLMHHCRVRAETLRAQVAAGGDRKPNGAVGPVASAPQAPDDGKPQIRTALPRVCTDVSTNGSLGVRPSDRAVAGG